MRATARLLEPLRVTFFTRKTCALCDVARWELSRVWNHRPFILNEIDILKPEFQHWRNLYEFDVPVIHISKYPGPEEDPERSSKAVKLMHRFTASEVDAKMDEVDGKRSSHGIARRTPFPTSAGQQ